MDDKSTCSTYFLIGSLLIIVLALVMVLLNQFRPKDDSHKPLFYQVMITHGKSVPASFIQQNLMNHFSHIDTLLKVRAADMIQHVENTVRQNARLHGRMLRIIPAHESLESFNE